MLNREQRPLLCWLPRSDMCFTAWLAHQWPPAHNGERISAQYKKQKRSKKTCLNWPKVDFSWHCAGQAMDSICELDLVVGNGQLLHHNHCHCVSIMNASQSARLTQSWTAVNTTRTNINARQHSSQHHSHKYECQSTPLTQSWTPVNHTHTISAQLLTKVG